MLISIGNTVVLCTAIVETQLPAYTTLSKAGLRLDWHIFCRHTNKQARTVTIQRLVGNSLHAVVGWDKFSITLDCDVLQDRVAIVQTAAEIQLHTTR